MLSTVGRRVGAAELARERVIHLDAANAEAAVLLNGELEDLQRIATELGDALQQPKVV